MAGRCAVLLLLPLLSRVSADLQLVVLHTNDMHARFEQTDAMSASCLEKSALEGRCYGGMARLSAAVQQQRAQAGDKYVLFLNAGDTFQGTVWYAVHKWRVAARFVNLLHFDAISLGNHEFDDNVAGLVPFINNVTCPVLCANVDLTEEPTLAATHLSNSTILEVGGVKIGVIGYLTPDTKILSNTENMRFIDEVVAITQESEKLKTQGVNIIIALGHSGYKEDRVIASQVPLVDLVVGGHTHSFLYTAGKQPDSEVPEGLYPTIVTQPGGKKVPVVQAYAYTKYLGKLDIVFDDAGNLKTCQGNPILLNSSIPQDPEMLKELEVWRAEVQKLSNETIGRTIVLLDGGTKSCRLSECNFGNLITDAIVDYRAREYVGAGWTDAPIAIMQGGGIRSSIGKSTDTGISRADVMSAMPFDDAVIKVVLSGEHVLEMLEWSVAQYDVSEAPGAFLQMSGLRVTYDLSKPVNQRIVSAEARCGSCLVPIFQQISKNSTYTILTTNFLISGGDGYSVLHDHVLNSTTLDLTDTQVVMDYIIRNTPVHPDVQGRITVLGEVQLSTEGGGGGGSSSAANLAAFLVPASLVLLVILTL